MENIKVVSIFFACSLFVTLLMVFVKLKWTLPENVRYIKLKIKRAESWREYVFWTKELRFVYWSILPGITPERAKNIGQFLNKKRPQKESHNDGLFSMAAPSIAGIVLCAVCLAGVTYAWFSSSASISTQSVESARYDVIAAIQSDDDHAELSDEPYTLLPNSEYIVTISVTEDNTASRGYCIITFGTDEKTSFYTELFPNLDKTQVSFTVKTGGAETQMQIFPIWGNYPEGHNIEDYLITESGIDLTD